MLDEFKEWAVKNNWKIVSGTDKKDLPDIIRNRYKIPQQWYDFICMLRVCENQTETTWFLTPDDYLPRNDGFQWNEFELQSLEWTDNDSSVSGYWDKHFPVVMSVDGEYSYYAVNTENGNVVNGAEPEYEISSVVAEDFNDFIRKIISGEIEL